MIRLLRGFGAGWVATVVLSLAMLCKSKAGVLPKFNAIPAIAHILGAPVVYGWLGHFAIGVVLWGGLFALIADRLPPVGGAGKGLIFGVFAWVAMMVIFMPVAGYGFLGLALGPPAAVNLALALLILHLVYGFVLGAVYALDEVFEAIRA